MSKHTIRVKGKFVSVMNGTVEAAYWSFRNNKDFDKALEEAKTLQKKLDALEIKRGADGRFIKTEVNELEAKQPTVPKQSLLKRYEDGF